MPEALVLRTAAFFGPWDVPGFLATTLERLRQGQPVRAAADLVVSPTYVPDLVRPCAAAALGWLAPRPRFSALTSERGRLLRPLPVALGAFIDETQRARAA